MLFKCNHPARCLGVRRDATALRADADFDVLTYHLVCQNCGDEVKINYAKTVGGVDAFLARREPSTFRKPT